jgi:translation initiation factor IF-2
MPVIITGLKNLPEFGDEFDVVESEKIGRFKSSEVARARRAGASGSATSSNELLRMINRTNKLSSFNVIVKADVQGSLTSVIDSLKTLDNEEVAVSIVSSGVGVVNESDVHTAATSGAIIYGFHISLPTHVKRLASRDKVPVRLYTIIYELIDDVKKELESMLAPEIVEEELGTLQVKGIFKISKTEVICGGQVTKGKLAVPSLARVLRGKELVADNLEVTKLQRGPTEVSEVPEGEMCGLSFRSEKRVEVLVDDRIELFSRQTKVRSL